MITNPQFFHDWENKLIADTIPDYEQNLRIFNMLLEEARMLGIIPLKDPLEGVEEKIKFARNINGAKYPPDDSSSI